eukprot:Amastigsp_a339626_190.p1 type:complete len:142 gc:universal Amastigsp_a339626_190:89-514(+)
MLWPCGAVRRRAAEAGRHRPQDAAGRRRRRATAASDCESAKRDRPQLRQRPRSKPRRAELVQCGKDSVRGVAIVANKGHPFRVDVESVADERDNDLGSFRRSVAKLCELAHCGTVNNPHARSRCHARTHALKSLEHVRKEQ